MGNENGQFAPPVQTPPLENPPEQKKSNSKSILIIVFTVCILILTVIGLLYFQGTKKSSSPQPQSTPNTESAVAGWNIYTSPTGDFTIHIRI